MADTPDRELVGIGGWLLFFVIALSVMSPLGTLVEIVALYSDPSIALSYGEAWPAIQVAELMLLSVSLGGLWFLTWRLIYVRNRTTVRLVIAGIWIIAVGGLLAELVIISELAAIPLSGIAAEMGAALVRPIVFCAIWTAYLMSSRRVANTYLTDRDAEEAARVFG